MVHDLADALTDRGMDPADVHREVFTAPAPTKTPTPQEAASDALVTVILGGAVTDVRAGRDEPILDAALRAGVQVPYSCRTGACFTCEARLVAGQVTNPQDTSAQPDAGSVLPCQSRPATDRLVLDFDRT